MPEKKFFKNVELLMTEGHLEDLKELLKHPQNEWVNVSLQPVVETDENGLIVRFRPANVMTNSLVFFFQQLMLEQRCMLMDVFMKERGVIK